MKKCATANDNKYKLDDVIEILLSQSSHEGAAGAQKEVTRGQFNRKTIFLGIPL